MPEILHRCVNEVMGKGHDEQSAYAICRTSLGLKSDGTEDLMSMEMTDDQMRAKLEVALQFQNTPSLLKDMIVCGPMGKFVNGDQSGTMTRKRLTNLVDAYKQYPRQVPIFMLGDHPENNDEQPPVGWVEGLKMDGDYLVARSKLMGRAASAVGGDLIRGASIYTVMGKNPDGSAQGEVLKHVLLTNEPFYKNLNVAAQQTTGAEQAACCFTALPIQGGHMADPEKKMEPKQEDKDRLDPNQAEPSVTRMKEKDAEIVALKGKLLTAEESIEDLKEKLSARPVDLEKEELAVGLKAAEFKLDALEVRELVETGLRSGTLKPSWCSGFKDGGYAGTMTWFKASKFGGDKKLLAWAVENSPVMYKVGERFKSGLPASGSEPTLTSDDRNLVRKLGYDPEAVIAGMKAKDRADFYEMNPHKKEN